MITIDTPKAAPEAFRPRNTRILVRRQVTEEKKGSLIVPDSYRVAEPLGEVLACGRGPYEHELDATRRPLDVAPGERVLFMPTAAVERHNGTLVEVNGEELPLIREDDVFAVLDAEGQIVRGMPGRVLVRRDPEPEQIGSVFVPSLTHKRRETSLRAGRGTVLTVGRPRYLLAGDLKPGDVVLFEPAAGRVRQWEGAEIVNLDERQVEAVETP